MDLNRIGVMAESFRKGLRGGVEAASEMGIKAVQIYANGEADPDTLRGQERKDFKKFLEDHDVVVSSLVGDLGGHGLERAEEQDWRMEKHKKQVELAVDLGCSVITTHIGIIPSEPANPRYSVMLGAVLRFASFSAPAGVRMAIETGPESADTLRGFLDRTENRTIGVNLDPANFAMVTGEDPLRAVRLLGDRIYQTHVKDGKLIKYLGSDIVYNAFSDGGLEGIQMEEYHIETALGEGSVPFPEYFKELKKTGFVGYNVIEREVGGDPAADIRKALDFLKTV